MQFKIILAIAFMLLHTSTFALGKVSRACRISDIPGYVLKHDALIAFEKIGNAPAGSLLRILDFPIAEQRYYIILESLTLDIYKRFYLFSQSDVNVYKQEGNGNKILNSTLKYSSPGYELLTFSSAFEDYLKANNSIFAHNRGYLSSSRAGHPNIIEYKPDSYILLANIPIYYSFEVIGRHFYHDPQIGRTESLGYSKANNCNLSEWGSPFQYSISDR